MSEIKGKINQLKDNDQEKENHQLNNDENKRERIKKEILRLGLKILVVGFVLAFAFVIGCPFKTLLGVPCMGCGMSRAFISLVCGNIKGAFEFHPLFFLLPLILGLILFEHKIPVKVQTIIWIVISVIFVTVYVIRLFVLKDPIVIWNFKDGLIGNTVLFLMDLICS